MLIAGVPNPTLSKRLLHIAYSGAGGVGEVAVELARRADRRRFEPAVCFFGIEPVWGGFLDRLESARIPWWYVPLRGRPRSLWRLFRRTEAWRPDCIVAHGPFQAAVFPLMRLTGTRAKAVAVLHGLPSLFARARGLLSLFPGLAAADRVVCVGPHLQNLLRERLGCDSVFIRHGIDIGEVPLPPGTGHEVLMLARLCPQKDHATLFAAAALLLGRRCAFRLRLGGDGTLRCALEKQARDLRLDRHIEFLGQLQGAEKQRHLARAAVFVYSTHEEGGSPPLAVLEAMAAARPIVATRVGGIAEALHHEKTALLVPPRDPVALAEAIESLLARPADAAALGLAARRVVEQNHSAEKWVRAYEDVFQSVFS